MPQDDHFWDGEGDAYYRRNRENHSAEFDMPLKMMKKMIKEAPKSVLEIGCVDGWRLEQIRQRYDCRCFGIEPSDEAVRDGSERYPKLTLKRTTAAEIPFTDTFDLVIVNFVLHWIDRSQLLRSLAEIDRVCGAYLIIGDFHAPMPSKREYHHLAGKGVYTYKQDYAKFFVDTACYKEVSRLVYDLYSTVDGRQVPDTGTQGVCSLLKKEEQYEEQARMKA